MEEAVGFGIERDGSDCADAREGTYDREQDGDDGMCVCVKLLLLLSLHLPSGRRTDLPYLYVD